MELCIPKDDWRKARIKDKIAGRNYKKQQEYEEKHDEKIDGWISKLEAKKKKGKKSED